MIEWRRCAVQKHTVRDQMQYPAVPDPAIDAGKSHSGLLVQYEFLYQIFHSDIQQVRYRASVCMCAGTSLSSENPKRCSPPSRLSTRYAPPPCAIPSDSSEHLNHDAQLPCDVAFSAFAAR
eukprot:3934445-Rhodomonas_salina.3